MGRIIAIANQKGGVGKTTTTVNLGASLAVSEKRVLLVDMDPQANTTSGLGIDREFLARTIYHAMVGHCSVQEITRRAPLEYLSVAPSTQDLVGLEVELVSELRREYFLQNALGEVRDSYDYILIDCPPTLGLLTINALTACDSILIPLQCEYYALEGLSDLMKTVELIRSSTNPHLEIEGVLLTMFDPRNNLSHQVVTEIRQHFKEKAFQTIIPRNIRLSEAPSHGKPIVMYDVSSKGALSYMNLGRELIQSTLQREAGQKVKPGASLPEDARLKEAIA